MAFNLTVFSPSAAQCETASLLWAGGRAPYSVSVLDARNPINMPTLDSAGSSLNSRMQYLVKIPAGTLVKFRVIDSGTPPQVADSTLVNIRDSGDDSCLPESQQTNDASTPTPSATRPAPSTDSDDETSTDSTEPQESTPSADVSTTRSSSPTGLSNTRSSRTSSQSSQSSATNTNIDDAAGSGGSSAPESSGVSGALVGGIVAGVIVLIFAIVGLLLWRKRRQRRAAQDDEDWFATQPSATVGRANTAVTRYNDDKDGAIVMSAVSPSSRANSLRGLMERDPSYRATTDASTEDVHSVYAQNMNIPQVIVTRDSFIGDVKRPINVLSAEDYSSGSSRPTRPAAQLPSAAMGLPSGSSSSSEDVQVPPQLSEAEMTRLADLVASRMRTADPEESPPVYHH